MRRIGFLLAFLAGLALSGSAFADTGAAESEPSATGVSSEPAFTIGPQPVWYLMGGVTGGGSVLADDRSGFVGGELSLVRVRDLRWAGIYADAYYDFGIEGTYVTAGPELGISALGLDVGGALRFANGETEVGAAGRLVFSLGVFTLYGRYIYMSSDLDEHVVQLGAMLKLPLLSPFGAGAPR